MRVPSYAEMMSLVAVADHGSFAKAALHLGISNATLSGSIRKLEDKIGVRLFNRTTRSVGLTEAGEHILEQAREMLTRYAALDSTVKAYQGKIAGHLRIVSPPPAPQVVLGSIIAKFLVEYPDITFDIVNGHAITPDFVSEGFDAGLGILSGIDNDMITVRVSGKVRTVIVASPDYLERHPAPQTPVDLKNHNCLRFSAKLHSTGPWTLTRGNERVAVPVKGSIVTNDLGFLMRAGLDGVGLMLVTQHDAALAIAGGQLIPVLQDWDTGFDGYYLYYPGRRLVPLPLRVLIDFVKRNTHLVDAALGNPADIPITL